MNNTAVRGGGEFFEVQNPALLRENIKNALDKIVSGSASGTAASIVSNRGQSGANLISAIFYPEKDFGDNQSVSWIGDLQNYWYYFDPFITNSTIREDTNSPNDLNLQNDYRIDFVFDDATNKTVARRYADDGKGNYTFVDTKDPDELKALWKAGRKLYERTLTTAPYRKFLINDTAADATTASLFQLTNDKFATLTSTHWSNLKNYLNVADDATATNVMKYIYGYDLTGFRKRSVDGYATVTTANPATGLGVWKLGDVITSTPRVQSDRSQNGYHVDYGDATYESYVTSKDYGARGMVYVGANDGALHAISLGKVSKLSGGYNQARLTGDDAGSEKWAFIPQNALPYLKYFTDPNYTHLYYVDNSTLLVDASLNKPASSCPSGVYWDCTRATAKNSLNELNLANTSWRSILIGQMGLGGASSKADATCTNCVKTPMNVVNFEKHGLSSVFALDVTNPENPTLKWEFSHPDLGYTTSEPAIVRINGKNASNIKDPNKNGRWFVVFASGPTGPIDPVSHQFYAKSDKPLKIFVVDLNPTLPFVQNSNYWIIDTLHDNTQIANAFGGSLATNAIDTDKNNRFSLGYYSTDVVYVGYVKKESGVDTWTDGGLLRLVTKEDPIPSNWVLSKVIEGVGPVTASIDKLYDDADKIDLKPVLWLYFGTGRYYYKNNTDGIDAADNQMRLFGIKDPCYSTATGPIKDIHDTCTTTLNINTLTDQSIISDTEPATLTAGKTNGWFIDLDDTGDFGGKPFKAERVVTSPSAKTNGLLQFTTFKPTSDICGFGGETMFWLVNYGTGGAPAPGTLKGKIMIQLSTGAIVVVDLSDISSFGRNGRQIDVGTGKPPLPAPPADALRKPVKKILHIQER
jgi:type IV pilus assembly protein PilY1